MAAMEGNNGDGAPLAGGPVHKGWMSKEGHDLRATLGYGDWKDRFFVLYYTEEWKEFHLLYYKDDSNFEVQHDHVTNGAHASTCIFCIWCKKLAPRRMLFLSVPYRERS
jgi:hypothetical protein